MNGSFAFLAQIPRYEHRLEGLKPSKRLIINILGFNLLNSIFILR
jgi:hypothetical protein